MQKNKHILSAIRKHTNYFLFQLNNIKSFFTFKNIFNPQKKKQTNK